MMNVSIWNNEALLTDFQAMFAQELSYTAIAKELSVKYGVHVTRCSISGKCSRMGLTMKPLTDEQYRERQRTAAKHKRPRTRFGLETATITTRTGIIRRGCNQICEAEIREVTYNEPIEHSEFAISLLEIHDRQCRYPLNDPGPGFLYCGAPTERTYCDHHHRLCHDRIRLTRGEAELQIRLSDRARAAQSLEEAMKL
jgi:hypothetical protein